jgi:hypothetical protein
MAGALGAAGGRDAPPDSGVMGRPKRKAWRRARFHPFAISAANMSRPSCEILDWFVGKVVWRIQRRPGVIAAVGSPPESDAAMTPRSEMRRGCRVAYIGEGPIVVTSWS